VKPTGDEQARRLGRLIVVSGPSGVGKGSVIAAAIAQRPETWTSISTTTRQPRPAEQEGREYFFVTKADFEREVASGGFLEWAEYADNLYGTAREPVDQNLASGRNVILEIELAGARQVRAAFPTAVLVLIRPPSMADLRERLIGRGTEPSEVVERRLATARHELAAESEFDYVLVNEDIGATASELVDLLDGQ